MIASMISKQLVAAILDQFSLGIHEIHGVAHWARVLENGRKLSADTGARLDVVELFAVLHDSRRFSNGYDPQHGARGADLASQLRGSLFQLDDAGFDLLTQAVRDHTSGQTLANVTVQTCWDSDRLDLARVRIYPRAELLCTPAARAAEMMAWSNQRAEQRLIPQNVMEEWGVRLKQVDTW
jgi:uncharacterized protein